MSRQREAGRQSALLGALFAADATDNVDNADNADNADFAERHGRLQRGLGAYRANAAGIAERALAAAYPTLAALIGPLDCAALARALWRASPPRRGDLAQWGRDVPEFIETQHHFDAWPYLADCARLDAAIQRCETAADAAPEPQTLAMLTEQPPGALTLRLLPSVQLLASDWPVATLHAAHRRVPGEHGSSAPDLESLESTRRAVAERRGESVVVARAAWRALPQVVDGSTFAWMRSLQDHVDLAEALAHAGPAFDFEAWLLQALQRHWLWKAEFAPALGAPSDAPLSTHPQDSLIPRRPT